jgi:cysteine-rich repeat protein
MVGEIAKKKERKKKKKKKKKTLNHTKMMRSWGENSIGSIGTGDTSVRGHAHLLTMPYIVFSDTIPVTDVSTGRFHTCAIFANGKGRCWGSRADRATGYTGSFTEHIGDDTTEMSNLPYLPLPGHLPRMMAIDAGQKHTCAIFANAEVYCWGDGTDGKTGQETAIGMFIDELPGPIKIHPNLTLAGLTAVATGCGDGFIDPSGYLPEECDDGNTVTGDGCTSYCSLEPFALCPTPGQPCTVADPLDASLYCSRLFTGDPGNVDGTYTVGPIGERGAVWCERETSAAGGAWTNVLSKGSGGADFYTTTATAIGDAAGSAPESVAGWRKLADRAINLAQLGAWPQQAEPLVVVRLRGSLDPDSKSWYIRGRLGLYVDTRKGFGLVPRSKTFEACRALDLAACNATWATYTSSVGTIDTTAWQPSATGDDTTGLFMDQLAFAGPRCALSGTDGDRCLSAGGGGSSTHAVARVDVMAVGAVCGDGVVDPVLENCDDGGVLGGDG